MGKTPAKKAAKKVQSTGKKAVKVVKRGRNRRTGEEPVVVKELREAILASGRSQYSIANESGIRPSNLARFMRGETDMHFTAAAAVAETLGLHLAPK